MSKNKSLSQTICNAITLRQAVDIVKTFQYLRLSIAKTIKFENDVVHTSDPAAP